ncbi:MAG TPA: DUF721 domain-containing protein [Aquamicrobium sp.]|jgi:hypothetical protein|nr:DUF721 domain-containing protein [Aquamicrobium sp.]
MTGKRRSFNAVPVSDLAAGILDPVLRKRAGITIGLVQSWDEIAGARLAATTRPERIAWPRRAHEDDPFEPGTLIVACEGMAALHLQHQTGEVIARVNAFLGFAAVGRLKIVQKPVAAPQKRRPRQHSLSGAQAARLDGLVSEIEDDGLREALARLGRSVMGKGVSGE